jgi:hypothetical protein
MNEIIQRIEEVITTFEKYENALYNNQCQEALFAVSDLQAVLRQISPQAEVSYAQERADEARLSLAVYQPHGRSKALRYLQARRGVISQLQRLVDAAKAVQDIISPQPRRGYPDYLSVVQPSSEDEQA